MRPINAIPERDRPRERLADLGADALSTTELLAILIGSGGSRHSAISIAGDLLAGVGSLADLGRAEPAQLARVSGIGSASASRILAGIELGRRALLPAASRLRVESPEQAVALLMPCYQGRDREHFGVLLLDARNGVLARRTIAIGSLNASLVHPRLCSAEHKLGYVAVLLMLMSACHSFCRKGLNLSTAT